MDKRKNLKNGRQNGVEKIGWQREERKLIMKKGDSKEKGGRMGRFSSTNTNTNTSTQSVDQARGRAEWWCVYMRILLMSSLALPGPVMSEVNEWTDGWMDE